MLNYVPAHKTGLIDGMKIFSKRFDIKGIFFVAVLFIASNAMAENATVPEATVYVPTSAWLVGPATLSVSDNPDSKIPCVVANQFSNGFVVRFSGGGDQLMAMAIDFRQKAFSAGQKYDVEFSMPGKYFQVLSGAAYDEGTLLFSLYKFPDFYKALQKANTLTIKAMGTTISINLVGLTDGIRRMNACYNPDQAQPLQKSAQGESSPQVSRQNPLIAEAANGLTPMPGEEPASLQPTGDQNRPDPEASVNAVLQNGGDVSPAGGSASTLIAKAKEAEQAAKDLSARNPIKESVQAAKPESQKMASSWSNPKAIRPSAPDVLVQKPDTVQPVMNGTQEMRWRAVKGADLHDILSSWTAGSGVKLIWKPAQDFAVQRSISMSGDFATAVQLMLEEYNDQTVRPVGRLYHEPGTSQMVLVVEQHAEKRE
jgi:hypothetical protein